MAKENDGELITVTTLHYFLSQECKYFLLYRPIIYWFPNNSHWHPQIIRFYRFNAIYPFFFLLEEYNNHHVVLPGTSTLFPRLVTWLQTTGDTIGFGHALTSIPNASQIVFFLPRPFYLFLWFSRQIFISPFFYIC